MVWVASPLLADLPWPYTPALTGSAPPQHSILLIGVGGGEVARVARSLERFGFRADVCGPAGVPFLPEEAQGYRRWAAILLGPLPGGARAFTDGQMEAIAGYVRTGGGIAFVGGMDSFAGAQGRGGYPGTPLAEVMPVEMTTDSDHVMLSETPVAVAEHPVLDGLPEQWPVIGERNRARARPDAQVLARFRDDPLLVVGAAGRGRTAALLTAWGWWAQRHFTLWPGYMRLWTNLAAWVGQVEPSLRPLQFEPRMREKPGFRLRAVNHRPLMATPEDSPFYAWGTSVEASTLDFVERCAGWGFNFFHLWADDPVVYARAGALAQAHGVKLALFVPQVPPYARFRDGSLSGSNIEYDSPWHRVPDFYSAEWEAAFRAQLRRMAQAIEPYRDTVAVLWITNEPEIYKAWQPWPGPDFCLNTSTILRRARQVAEERFGEIGGLNRAWGAGSHPYAFESWDDFQARLLDELFADFEADGRLAREAHRWLLDFVCNTWLREWHATVRRILQEEGLSGPLLGARHNYNSAPDLALIPWGELDLCGKNLYTHEDSDAYVAETWDAFRAGGLPVLMSEWGVQPAKLPLGYLHGSDEVNRAEQAALGRALASRCPWVIGDVWSNVRDIDYPWGFLDDLGRPKAFVELLGRATHLQPMQGWSPVEPGEYQVGDGSFAAPGVRVERTAGPPDRKPGVVFAGD